MCKLKTKLELGDCDFNEIANEEGLDMNIVRKEFTYLDLKIFNDDTMDYYSIEEIKNILKRQELKGFVCILQLNKKYGYKKMDIMDVNVNSEEMVYGIAGKVLGQSHRIYSILVIEDPYVYI